MSVPWTPAVGKLIDNAMDLIEVDNPGLRCMVPKTYARLSLDVRRIGEFVNLISNTEGRTSWAVSTSTSSAGAAPPRPRAAASSTPGCCPYRARASHLSNRLRVLRRAGLGPQRQTGTIATYMLIHPLVVDLFTVARSRLHEVINDQLGTLPDCKPTSPTSRCPEQG